MTPTVAKYDLDNIRLEDMAAGERLLYAQFELQHILVEGNCVEFLPSSISTPRGLQLLLEPYNFNLSNDDSQRQPAPVEGDRHYRAQDTIVMSNYGYFQLKANPGVW